MKKKEDPKEPEPKKEASWKPNWIFSPRAYTMASTTEENLLPIERLIAESRGNNHTMYAHRNLLFVLLILSLVAHAVR